MILASASRVTPMRVMTRRRSSPRGEASRLDSSGTNDLLVRSCFFDEVVGYGIPLLAKEGWREAPGWSLTAKRFEMRFETWLVGDHPVSAASEASRHFLSGRATPPSQGGECAPPEKLWLRPQAALCLCG